MMQRLTVWPLKKIEQWLSIRTLDELKQLNAEAKQHFLYHGITFNVYGDKEGVERTIPFDLIPRVIEKKTVGKNRSWLRTAS